MDRESIGIRGIGLCTAGIHNVEELCDQIIEHGKSGGKRGVNPENSVQKALEEADALEEPVLWVKAEGESTTSLSLYQALKQAKEMDHAAIICTQTAEDGFVEAAVLFTSMRKEEKVWADLTEGKEGKENPIPFVTLYKKRGPVQEAGEVIVACINARYGMQELQEKKEEQVGVSVAIHGGTVCIEEPNVLLDDSVLIKKQLVPVSFLSREEGMQKLNHLLSISERLSLADLSKNTRKGFLQSRKRKRTVVFAAEDKESLQMEVKAFLSVQSKWDNPGYIWKTKEGSFYTAEPLSYHAKIALISPPLGMFSNLRFYRLYRALPEVRMYIKEKAAIVGKEGSLMKRYAIEILSRSAVVQAIKELGIPFDIAAGISMGETFLPMIVEAMEPEASLADIFKMLEKDQPKLEQDYFEEIPEGELENWYVVCEQEAVSEAINAVGEGEVFLTMAGSPSEVLICGRALACKRVLEELGTYGVKAEDALYIHTPVLEPIREEIYESIKRMGVHKKEQLGFSLYSSSLKKRLGEDAEEFATALTESLIKTANLPELLESLYNSGCRVFFDLSSSKICSKWIRESLRNKEDVLVTSFFEEADAADSLPLLLAQLMSYGVGIRYEQFYGKLNWKSSRQKDVRTQLLERLMQYNEENRSGYRIMEDHVQCNSVEEKKQEPQRGRACFYRRQEIEEMSNGSMARVLGERYRELDQYNVRIRLPGPPLLFLSRITRIGADYGVLEDGSYIEGEFDITGDTLLLLNQTWISNAVLAEAGQIGRLLTACMGIDAVFGGKAAYRILDVTQEFYGGPWLKVGDTMKLSYTFDRMIHDKERILFFSTYEIRFLGKPWMQFKYMGECFHRERACAYREIKEKEKPEVMFEERCPLYHPLTGRHQFSKEKMASFLYGKAADCFGEKGTGKPQVYWRGEEACFVDQILDISSEGGSYGYGYVFGEKEIEEAFWPFLVSVKNDPFLPDSILEEMVAQVIAFFEYYMGLSALQKESIPHLVKNHPNRSRFGGTIRPGHHVMIIKAEPRIVKQIQDRVLLIYDGAVYCDGEQVLKQEGIAYFL